MRKSATILFLALLSALSICGCTPAQQAAIGPAVAVGGQIACTLVTVLVGGPNGTFAGNVCEDVFGVVSKTIAALPAAKLAASAPCLDLVHVKHIDGSDAGAVCAGYADAAQGAIDSSGASK